ncbi:hypothetical protein HELRODRAFT_172910 [Helobdella robusta]|uniref:Uncharacterized protein n=1 Tax=Helobdella robusta TaxID=6412 RepID=T1F644_HELRO|nr:hypothetical protein HELRODRAFT_172910 [Helobdella robusta]ESO03885.1 hypothetical protein HELRODRAFT_172910 [Helobdella robusta]
MSFRNTTNEQVKAVEICSCHLMDQLLNEYVDTETKTTTTFINKNVEGDDCEIDDDDDNDDDNNKHRNDDDDSGKHDSDEFTTSSEKGNDGDEEYEDDVYRNISDSNSDDSMFRKTVIINNDVIISNNNDIINNDSEGGSFHKTAFSHSTPKQELQELQQNNTQLIDKLKNLDKSFSESSGYSAFYDEIFNNIDFKINRTKNSSEDDDDGDESDWLQPIYFGSESNNSYKNSTLTNVTQMNDDSFNVSLVSSIWEAESGRLPCKRNINDINDIKHSTSVKNDNNTNENDGDLSCKIKFDFHKYIKYNQNSSKHINLSSSEEDYTKESYWLSPIYFDFNTTNNNNKKNTNNSISRTANKINNVINQKIQKNIGENISDNKNHTKQFNFSLIEEDESDESAWLSPIYFNFNTTPNDNNNISNKINYDINQKNQEKIYENISDNKNLTKQFNFSLIEEDESDVSAPIYFNFNKTPNANNNISNKINNDMNQKNYYENISDNKNNNKHINFSLIEEDESDESDWTSPIYFDFNNANNNDIYNQNNMKFNIQLFSRSVAAATTTTTRLIRVRMQIREKKTYFKEFFKESEKSFIKGNENPTLLTANCLYDNNNDNINFINNNNLQRKWKFHSK